jgi:hypothetical protein
VDPAGEGVVEGNVVLGDESAAGGCRSEAAQAEALGGWVGDQRAGAAERFYAGDKAKLAVEGDGGGLLEILGGEEAGAGGAFEVAEGGALGGDGDGLVDRLDCGGLGWGWCLAGLDLVVEGWAGDR